MDDQDNSKAQEADSQPRTAVTPEIEVYIHTLAVTLLLRHEMVDQVRAFARILPAHCPFAGDRVCY